MPVKCCLRRQGNWYFLFAFYTLFFGMLYMLMILFGNSRFRLHDFHVPLTRYVKLRVAHAPGMPATFSRHRLQRQPLVSDPGTHQGTCVAHVPWCMSGSLTRGVGENVPGIPGACTTRNFTYLVRGPWPWSKHAVAVNRGWGCSEMVRLFAQWVACQCSVLKRITWDQ